MAVSKRLRYEILRRDNHACRYCGAHAPDVELTVDHVTPVALGGRDTTDNLVASCRDCNAGKSSVPADAPIVADVEQDAVRWSRAIHRATELALAERDRLWQIEKQVYLVFHGSALPSYKGGGTYADHLPQDWFATVDRFHAQGLAVEELTDAATVAIAARIPVSAVFRYFCGVCIRKIEQRHSEARALLETEE